MDKINGINLGRIQKKNIKKAEVEQQPKTVVPQPEIDDKKSSKAAMAYALAAMILATPALQSCVETEATAISNNEETNKLLQQLLEAAMKNNEQNDTMIGQNNTIISQNETIIAQGETRIEQNQEMITILSKVLSGVMDLKEGVNQIYLLGLENNKFDVEFLAKLDTIINGQGTEQEKLDAIVNAIIEQNQKLANIENVINIIAAQDKNLGEVLVKFYEAFLTSDKRNEEYQNTSTEFMNKALDAILKSNTISADILAEIKNFKADYDAGKMSDAELWAKIVELLQGIKDDTGSIRETVKEMAIDLKALNDKLDTHHDEQIAILTGMKYHIENIDNDLDDLKKLQANNNETVVNMFNTIDGISVKIDSLAAQNNGYLTKDDLKEIFGPMYEGIMEKLGNINDDQISIGDVQAALQGYKTDLTKTNSLIETLITVVQNLNTSGDRESLIEVLNSLAELKNIISASSEAKLSALNEIKSEIASLKLPMEALVTTANQIKANQDSFQKDAITFGTKLFEEIAKLGDGIDVNFQKVQLLGENYKEYLVRAEQTRQEKLAVLQIIAEKMDQNGQGVDIDQLKELLPDYTDILTEISDKIGKVITSKDLENFFLKTQPDLTKTNNLIETLITVVQNINFSGGGSNVNSQDLNAIKNTVNKILEAFINGRTIDENMLKEVIEYAKKIAENTTGSNSPLAYQYSPEHGGYIFPNAWNYNWTPNDNMA